MHLPIRKITRSRRTQIQTQPTKMLKSTQRNKTCSSLAHPTMERVTFIFLSDTLLNEICLQCYQMNLR
ncbi:hypothetical protein KPH14_012483 [Odynerus spinipes]|uniref:Uncharacterized protein n=1 Tax=Odynerus spinipes TaxID=1348599 RepID=A0AAD9RI67_9HYME|nr:hypothetical protein KPH14_012483 [Odynerus spinipes]